MRLSINAISLRGMDPFYLQSKWFREGRAYTLECFIDWQSFTASATPGGPIGVEMRARDDEDDGDRTYRESMFQWGTTNYEIGTTGEGMGVVTLSTGEVQRVSGISNMSAEKDYATVYPDPFNDITDPELSQGKPCRISLELYSLIKYGYIGNTLVYRVKISSRVFCLPFKYFLLPCFYDFLSIKTPVVNHQTTEINAFRDLLS